MNYFITAIGTDAGKTLVAAIITEALQADYWKPIQAGAPRDTETVQSLISNAQSKFHPEAYLLKHAESPHSAAKKENISIDLKKIQLPQTSNSLVIEGAGGILVPINEHQFVIDLVPQINAQVILVSQLYLGSINHTLLTVAELKRRNINVKGIIFNGPENKPAQEIILNYSGYKNLLHILQEKEITKEIVKKYASKLVYELI